MVEGLRTKKTVEIRCARNRQSLGTTSVSCIPVRTAARSTFPITRLQTGGVACFLPDNTTAERLTLFGQPRARVFRSIAIPGGFHRTNLLAVDSVAQLRPADYSSWRG